MKTVMTVKTTQKLISMILILLLIFYIIPSTVYAEVVGAFSMQENEADDETAEETPVYEYEGVVYEVEDLREERVKHFHLEDGSYVAAQYPHPVHYADENGKWQDIDNALESSGSDYSNSNARIKFSKKITGNSRIFALHDGNMKINMSLIGAIKGTAGQVFNNEDAENTTQLQKLMSLEKMSSRVIYEDILDGVDLEYIATGLNVKENIIVKERKDTYSYAFELALNNLTAILTENGDISLLDRNGEEEYVIPAPIVYDSSNTYAESGLSSYTLSDCGNGKYIMTVSVNSDWMNSADRVYPITVDPTVRLGDTFVYDTTIYSTSPTESHAGNPILTVSPEAKTYVYDSYVGGTGRYEYTTQMYIGMALVAGCDAYIGAYQIWGTWDDTLTWNQAANEMYPFLNSNILLDYQVVDQNDTENGGWYYWDITSVAYLWDKDLDLYTGIMFELLEGTPTATFYSSDNNGVDAPYRPYTIRKYREMNGVEDYWSAYSHSVGAAGSGSVNYANGNLTFAIPTLTTTNSLMTYTPTLVYNLINAGMDFDYYNGSSAYNSSYAPRGFKMNIAETVILKPFRAENLEDNNDFYYVHSDADGTAHYFYKDPNQAYTYHDEDGLQRTITVDADRTELTLTDDSEITKHFLKMSTTPATGINEAWYLSAITDNNGNKLYFEFDSYKYKPYGVYFKPNNSDSMQQLHFAYSNNGKISVICNLASKEAVIFKYSSTTNGEISSNDTQYLREIWFATTTQDLALNNWQRFFKGEETAEQNSITVNAVTKYTYNYDGFLEEVEDTRANYKVRYGIYANAASIGISEIEEFYGTAAGQKTTFSIGVNGSQVRNSGSNDIYGDSDDVVWHYSFDNEGRTVSLYSSNVSGTEIYGASMGEYEKQENVKNNLKYQLNSGGSFGNLLQNGGFTASGTQLKWTLTGKATHKLQSDKKDFDIQFLPRANTTSTMSQEVFLKAGDYTLSIPVTSAFCGGVSAKVKIISENSGFSHVEEIPLSKEASRSGDFSTTFTVNSHANGGDELEISVEVIGANTVESGSLIEIDSVMLVCGIKSAKFSLVNFGSFEYSEIGSNASNNSISDYWVTESGGAPTIITNFSTKNNSLKVVGDLTSEKYVKQRVFEATPDLLNRFDDSGAFTANTKEYVLSGFVTASVLPNENSFAGFRVDVIYYLGSGASDVTVSHFIEAKSGSKTFLSALIDTEYDAEGEFLNLSCIKAIDVCCVYSNRPTGSSALFDDVSFVECDDKDVEKYYYYENGLLAKKENVFYEEVYEYNSDRNLSRVANNYGELTDYIYDSSENLIKTTNYDFAIYVDGVATSIKYPLGADNPDSIITKTPKAETAYTYDSFGLLTEQRTYEISSAAGNAKKFKKNYVYETTPGSRIFGALKREIDGLSNTVCYYYDPNNGRLLATVNPETNTGSSYTYDASGKLIGVTPASYVSENVYSPISNSASVEYTYNDLDYLSTITTESTVYTLVYDAFGNQSEIKAGNYTLASYEYNPNNGKLVKVDYGNGFSVEYVYNRLEMLSEIWYTYSNDLSEKAYEYEYTEDGQIYEVRDLLSGKATVYTYDTNKRLVDFAEYDTDENYKDFSSSILYNDKGQTSLVTHKLNYAVGNSQDYETLSYSYNYNADGSLASLSSLYNATEFTLSYGYDNYDRLTGYEFYSEGGMTNEVSYAYKEYGENTSALISSYTSTLADDTTVTYTYTYDGVGNITKISYSTGGEIRYVYDELNQLVREDNELMNETTIIVYDDAGNILSRNSYELTAAGETPTTLKYGKSYTYSNASWGDLLTAYNGNLIVYDAIGNPLLYHNGATYSWTGRDLTGASYDGGTYVFTYNDDGIRTSKSKNGAITSYILSGSQIVAEKTPTELFVYMYDASGAPIGFQYRKNSYAEGVWDVFWYEKNMLGDVVAVYSDSGAKLVSYTYDAWGLFNATYHNSGAATAAYKNPFRYRGYYYDSDLGLYYLNSRYYDANTGRFVNADVYVSTGQGLLGNNMYAYCGNNPVNFVDCTGEWAFLNNIFRKIRETFEDIVEIFVSAFEAEVAVGFGFGVNIGDNISVGVTHDTYVGIDDSEIVTGNKYTGGAEFFDSDISLGTSYDYRAEQGGNRVSTYIPDNQFSAGPFVGNGEGELLVSFSLGAHFLIGGQISISFNVTEFIVRLFD